MSEKMSDEQVGTELERIKLHELWDECLRQEPGCEDTFYSDMLDTLRLLAESQAALGEIDGLLQHQLDNEEPDDLVTILQLLEVLKQIAGKHYRGGK